MKLYKNKSFVKILLFILCGILLITATAFSFILGYSATPNFPSGATELFNVQNITIKETENNEEAATWTIGQSSIDCKVTGEDGGTCSSASSNNGEIEITYTGTSNVQIEFEYECELNGGSCTIDGNNINDGEATFTLEIDPNVKKSFVIFVKSPKSSASTNLKISNFSVLSDEIFNVNFLSSEGGSYQVNGVDIIENTSFDFSGREKVLLTVKNDSINEEYCFVGWILNGNLYSDSLEIEIVFSTNSTIYAYFELNTKAIFKNGNKVTSDFDEVLDYASTNDDKRVLLLKDGEIRGGTSGNIKEYYLSEGIQLIIPDDETYQTYLGETLPIYNGTGNNNPKVYRKLIVPDYTKIIASNGSIIYVASKAPGAAGNQLYGGNPTNTYGQIILQGNESSIILYDGSTLYAYGYITGSGRVESLYGSLVREFFQITDFKGGSVTLSMLSERDSAKKRTFIINKYYIQNIECSLIIHYGAKEEVVTGFVMSIIGLTTAVATFISPDNNDFGLFKLSEGARLEKKYNGAKDRIEFNLLEGNFYFSNISLTVSAKTVNTKDYELPINNNMTINICSGTNVTIAQDLCVLPGAEINIEEDAVVNVAENNFIYFFNSNSYIGKKYSTEKAGDIGQVNYSVSRTYTRTTSDLCNATLNINGTLNILNGGGIFTTRSGDENNLESLANFYSSLGTGVIGYVGTPSNKNLIYQYNFSDGYDDISVSVPSLRNSINSENVDDTYLELRSYESLTNKSFSYSLEKNEWIDNDIIFESQEITFVDNTYGLPNYTETFVSGESFVLPTADTCNFVNGNYQVRFWQIDGVDDGLFRPGETITINRNQDITAIAIWGGRINNKGNFYYVDYLTGDFLTGLNRVEHYNTDIDGTYIFKFTNDGILDLSYSGTFHNDSDNRLYFILNGEIKTGPSLYSFQNNEQLGTNIYNYVYVVADNHVFSNGNFYIKNNEDDILPSGYYDFDENGYIVREDSDSSNYNQKIYIKGDSTFIDGIRVAYGLFEYDNYLYYSDSNGYIVKDKTFYVSKNNGYNVTEGLYYFNSEGKMCDESLNVIEVDSLL